MCDRAKDRIQQEDGPNGGYFVLVLVAYGLPLDRATKVSEFGYRNCAGVGRVAQAAALVCLAVRCLSQCPVASTINLLNLAGAGSLE